MGGAPSRTRKITIENENPTSVIKVTDECVQRLKGYQGKPVSQTSETSSSSEAAHGVNPGFLVEPSLTSIQLRQANLQALQDNDKYWSQRITNLQRNHEQIKNVMEQEYEKAKNDVAGAKQSTDQLKKLTSVPCGENRARIIDCYRNNKNEPMKCAKEVQAFSDCVDRSTLLVASK